MLDDVVRLRAHTEIGIDEGVTDCQLAIYDEGRGNRHDPALTAIDVGQIQPARAISPLQILFAAKGESDRQRESVIDVAQDRRARSNQVMKTTGAATNFSGDSHELSASS